MPAACERPCPLVLYLHSASGRGDDNETNINGGRRWGASFGRRTKCNSATLVRSHPAGQSPARPNVGALAAERS
ncbi:MAG: hypothetical protein R2724_14190 [Bryobacterales bacterium]